MYDKFHQISRSIPEMETRMDFELRDRVRKSIFKAKHALDETQYLYAKGLLPGTVSRAYSAIFHSAAAILISENMEIIKPSAVVPFFAKEIVKRGLIESSYQQMFADAYECYQVTEFDIYGDVDLRRANSMLDMSQAFVERMESYLRDNGWV